MNNEVFTFTTKKNFPKAFEGLDPHNYVIYKARGNTIADKINYTVLKLYNSDEAKFFKNEFGVIGFKESLKAVLNNELDEFDDIVAEWKKLKKREVNLNEELSNYEFFFNKVIQPTCEKGVGDYVFSKRHKGDFCKPPYTKLDEKYAKKLFKLSVSSAMLRGVSP